LYSNYGPLNAAFESRVQAEVFDGDGSCVTVNNATIGLMLAIMCSKRPGKYAVMPSFTFAAAPLAARWCGLEPYFVDIDPDTWAMSESRAMHALDLLRDQVAVVMPYATFGTAIDLTWYRQLVNEGVPVVVDAAASFGCEVDGMPFGRGFPGSVVYSFHATKAFGVGEGGLVYSGSRSLVERIRRAGNFGFNDDRTSTMMGLNSKLSEYVAAIALATLDTFDAKTRIRHEIYSQYVRTLTAVGLLDQGWQLQEVTGVHAHQFFPLLTPANKQNSAVVAALESANVQARTYFAPACHQQPQFARASTGELPVTEALAKRILSLPLYEEITGEETAYVVESLPT